MSETPSETPYLKILSATIFGAMIGVLPSIYMSKNSLEKKIEELKPIVREEQVFGAQTPEKFYEIDGKRVYLEIDGKPMEQYFGDRTKIE